jgi:hypothetical protein
MANKLWPGQNPLGKTFLSGDSAELVTVVGVSVNGKYQDLYESGRALMYLPFSQHYESGMNLVVRTAGDPRLWIEPLRKAMTAAGVEAEFQPITFNDWMDFATFTERITAAGVAILSGLGLLLAMLGLFGAISYSVSERKKELGIRVALGAARGQLICMVLGETLIMTGVGVGIAMVPGVAATVLLKSQFYGIRSVEWTVLVPVCLSMVILSLVVAYVSARPWLRVDPMEAVRHA